MFAVSQDHNIQTARTIISHPAEYAENWGLRAVCCDLNHRLAYAGHFGHARPSRYQMIKPDIMITKAPNNVQTEGTCPKITKLSTIKYNRNE